MAKHNNIGKEGEKIAKAFLLKKGYNIIHSNWRIGNLEVDLIAEDQEEIVFIEVKTRTDEDYDSALESVTMDKEHNLVNAANIYLQQLSFEAPCRFDVIAVKNMEKKWSILHITDAFSGVTSNFESN